MKPTITLENFEGPIDFLLHLIQKNEIDIYSIMLKQITEQYSQKLKDSAINLENGADFILVVSTLILLKSKMLLPKPEQIESDTDPCDPRFEIIHQLLEYCQFKDIAKELSEREKQQGGYYARAPQQLPDIPKNLGIEHLTIQDLAQLLKDLFAKAPEKKQIYEEIWKVSDKISFLRTLFKTSQRILFTTLFTSQMCRNELIVTFLALLELMKLGEASIVRNIKTQEIEICLKAKVS